MIKCHIFLCSELEMQIIGHIFLAFSLRLFLILYGEWHDMHMLVKYTDVDYHVLTDGARLVAKGSSPFQRHTYRYTPLLSFMLLPNVFVCNAFGKLLFSAFDVLTGYLIYCLIKYKFKSFGENQSLKYSSLWLYNPLPVLVSTRGNAESLLSTCVILTLYLLYSDRIYLCGLVYGLSVHFKIYPVIYALPLYLALTSYNNKVASFSTIVKLFFPNKKQIEFAISAVLSFSISTILFYYLYGKEYVSEAFLYHITRKDIRHNFSPFFYLMYLTEFERTNLPLGFIAFFPQLVLLLLLSLKFGCLEDLPLCIFSETVIFVTFNKVCTSQYFLWYLCILPVVAPHINMTLKKGCFLLVLWILGQATWLLPAYLLEFQGQNTFLFVWLAGLMFFMVNIGILSSFISSYNSPKLVT